MVRMKYEFRTLSYEVSGEDEDSEFKALIEELDDSNEDFTEE